MANSVTASLFVGDLSGNASTATKALQDARGSLIAETYIASITENTTENGMTISFYNNDTEQQILSTVNIPNDKVYTSSTNTGSIYITGTQLSEASYGTESFSTSVYIDATTGKITAPAFVGSLEGNAAIATSATKDAIGNIISQTYLASVSSSAYSSGTSIYFKSPDSQDTIATINVPNTSVYVQSNNAGTLYITGTKTNSNGYRSQYFSPSISANLATGQITAPDFKGHLTGSADLATVATYDTAYDPSSDNNIRIIDKYLSDVGITHSNNFNYAYGRKGDGQNETTATGIPNTDGLYHFYNNTTTDLRNIYVILDQEKINLLYSQAKGLNARIVITPYQANTNFNQEAGEVFLKAYKSSNADSFSVAHCFDYLNVLPNKDTNPPQLIYSTLASGGSQASYIAIKIQIKKYGEYDIGVFPNGDNLNLVKSISTTAPEGDLTTTNFVQTTSFLPTLTLGSKTYNGLSSVDVTEFPGNAATATTATNAINDGNGSIIRSTYIDALTSEYTSSGVTISTTHPDTQTPGTSVFIQTNQVFQSNTTSSDNTNYSLLLAASDSTSSVTGTTNKNNNLIYNPSTSTLTTINENLTGSLSVTGDTYLNNSTYITDLTASSLQVTGQTNFINIPTAPTASTGTNTTQIATTEFVQNTIANVQLNSLTIGSYVFNGTSNVVIPIYSGQTV